MRARASVRELDSVQDIGSRLYAWQVENRAGSDEFVLHDGPPFANGSLHAGHFLNKGVKDFIVRFQLMLGKRVHHVPGWDTHGLPIEIKALKGVLDTHKELSASEVRSKARRLAQEAIGNQKADLERWGVLADWENTSDGWYETMSPAYEEKQLEVFENLVANSFVHRGLKPVFWSYSSRTALAEAEIEYVDDHESLSVLVDFPLRGMEENLGEKVFATIWTTTPWTLPANMAIAVNPNASYSVVCPSNNRKILRVIGTELLGTSTLKQIFPEGHVILKEIAGSALIGMTYEHPLSSSQNFNFLAGEHVSMEAGTGLVHTAPTHGHDDYALWKESGHRLEDCPFIVSDEGTFSFTQGHHLREEIAQKLEGKHIHEQGNREMLVILREFGMLAAEPEIFKHRYPYDWRTKKPIIVRATNQWFINLSSLKATAARALEGVQLVPASSRPRLSSMLQGRDEWCISRQRRWGVPIPALYNGEKVWMDKFVVRAARAKIAEKGSDIWFENTSADLENAIANDANRLREEEGLPPVEGTCWKRGLDTMDVWFDSGCSWKAVLEDGKVADVILEGSDQHRGWFQSSLLTRVSFDGKAPYKMILTHGFVMDEHDKKMSKSLGNVVSPNDVITGKSGFDPFGVDVLRLWAASVDFTKDVSLGKEIVKDASDNVRKVRNVARFLLGNLNGFEPGNHKLGNQQLGRLEEYMLYKTAKFVMACKKNYSEYRFQTVHKEIIHFVSTEVSSFYAPAVKDQLYNDLPNDSERRSIQVVFWEILQSITLVIAPILCFTAQDIFKHAVREIGPFRGATGSEFAIHQLQLPDDNYLETLLLSNEEQSYWANLRKMCGDINVILAKLRREQLDVEIILRDGFAIDEKATEMLLTKLLQVSSCRIVPEPSGKMSLAKADILNGRVFIKESEKTFCERCRRFAKVSEEQKFCSRCASVVDSI